jgi:uncharacterized protein YciI
MAKYVAILTFADNESTRLAIRPKHREYLRGLFNQGKLAASGPFTDDTGALIIYEAADEAEARALIAADPYTPAGVVADLKLKEWKQVLPS